MKLVRWQDEGQEKEERERKDELKANVGGLPFPH